MSDRRPMARFGAEAPDAAEVRERHVVLRVLRRVRSFFVLVPLVVGLLVVASIGASKLWADLPMRPAPDPEVTCWNGEVLPSSECTEPTGTDGLRWVFPSFRPFAIGCSRVERPKRDQERPLEFACEQRFDQRAVTITYSVRTSLEDGLAFLRKRYGNPVEEADGTRLVFRAFADAAGNYKTTVAYAEHPFAVTVEAPGRDLRDMALGELVRFRDADQIRIRSR